MPLLGTGTPDAGGGAQIGSALRNGIGGGGIRFGPFCAPTLHKKWMIPRCVYQRVRVRSTGRQSGRISADCQVGRGRLGGEISTILKSTLLEPVICVLCQTQKCEIQVLRSKTPLSKQVRAHSRSSPKSFVRSGTRSRRKGRDLNEAHRYSATSLRQCAGVIRK